MPCISCPAPSCGFKITTTPVKGLLLTEKGCSTVALEMFSEVDIVPAVQQAAEPGKYLGDLLPALALEHINDALFPFVAHEEPVLYSQLLHVIFPVDLVDLHVTLPDQVKTAVLKMIVMFEFLITAVPVVVGDPVVPFVVRVF
jgi:hypothetical protein